MCFRTLCSAGLLVVMIACGADKVTDPDNDPAPTTPTAAGIQVVSGSGQSGNTSAGLASPVTFQVNGSNGSPFAGAMVTFSASNGGSVSPTSGTSGSNGQVATTWTLGSATGAQTLTATVASFQATATATASAPIVTLGTPTLTATNISTTRIDLSWTDVTSETGYRIERCSGVNCSSFATLTTTGADVTTYSNTGLTANTFRYRVRAENGSSVGSFSAPATSSTEMPTTATLTATATNSTTITLAWNDVSYETGYVIERCSGVSCSSFTTLVSPLADATSYANTGLSANTSYSYRVRGVNGGIAGANSATATANTNVPATPVLSVRASNNATNVLTWADVAGETIYDVLYCTGSGCTPDVSAATPAAGTVSYNHDSRATQTVYRYRVRGRNGSIAGTPSNTVEVQTIGLQPDGPCNLSVCATTISGLAGSKQYYWVDVPAGQDSLIIQLKAGTGDADLYFATSGYPDGFGSSIYVSNNGAGVSDGMTLPLPPAGRWYITIMGATAFSGFELFNSPVKLMSESSFEQLGLWNLTGWAQRLSGAARTGSVSANLSVDVAGYSVNADGGVYQDIQVPSAAGTVTAEFYHRILSNEPNSAIPYDYLYVRVRSVTGVLLGTLLTLSNTNLSLSGSYALAAVDITPWRGQVIRLSFESDNDGAYPTQYQLDDVKMRWTTRR